MNNTPQRLRITEPGWASYTGHFGGVEFKNGLSTEVVDSVIAARLGSIVRVQMVDTDQQAGHAAELIRVHNNRAEVVPATPTREQIPEAPKAEKEPEKPTYTREMLEAEADAKGIAGLRAIADKFGIKGRGIVELIDEILKAQEVR